MKHSTQSNYRFLISLLFRILVIVGILLVLSIFIGSLYNSDKSLKLNDNSHLIIKLNDMDVGEIKKIKVGYIPIWIYKRRKIEIKQLSHLNLVLTDPPSSSILSTKLKSSQHQYRSIVAQYFVFKPIESIRSCSIRYLEQPNSRLAFLLSDNNIPWLGGFTESCFGSVYDLAGRRYRSTGNKNQKNLGIPEYSINITKQQGDVIQFDIKTIELN